MVIFSVFYNVVINQRKVLKIYLETIGYLKIFDENGDKITISTVKHLDFQYGSIDGKKGFTFQVEFLSKFDIHNRKELKQLRQYLKTIKIITFEEFSKPCNYGMKIYNCNFEIYSIDVPNDSQQNYFTIINLQDENTIIEEIETEEIL